MKATGSVKMSCLMRLFQLPLKRSRQFHILIPFMVVVLLVAVVFLYYVPEQKISALKSAHAPYSAWLTEVNFTEIETDWTYRTFDSKHDVLVFLHIQKTGGSTFGRHVARDSVGFPAPCRCQASRKRCDCRDEQGWFWLFSRESAGWACGLHSDWTELHECVPSMLDRLEGVRRRRRYLYITTLRNPVQRFLSEWKHVQRGSTWRSASLTCNGRQASILEVPFCFKGDSWANVTLDEFMDCRHNLAINRQTRMLADLTLVGCYNTSFTDPERRQNLMLKSAITNLQQMAFFGILENQSESQLLFERTFGAHFTKSFVQANATHAQEAEVTEDQLQRIIQLNRLDVELYDFAKQLFEARVLKALNGKSVVKENTNNHLLSEDKTRDFTRDELTHISDEDGDEEERGEEDDDDDEDDDGDLQ